jgi:hypothetical protein
VVFFSQGRSLGMIGVRIHPIKKSYASPLTCVISLFFFFSVTVADGAKPETRPQPIDVSKADKVFGIKYRSMADTAKDMLDDFKAKGWTK